MALQDILKKVLEDAAKKVAEIEAKQSQEIDSIKSQLLEAEKDELSVLSDQTQKGLDLIQQKSETEARREQKKFQLAAKSSVLNSVLDSFYAYLLDLSDADYSNIVSVLLADIDDTGVLMVPADKLELTKKIAAGKFSVEASDMIKGGFILKSESLSIDNSFKNVVYSEYKTTIESFFAQKLALI